jgi:spore coat protein CotF
MYDYSIASEVSQSAPVLQQSVSTQTPSVLQQSVSTQTPSVLQQSAPTFSTVSTQLASTFTPEVIATKLGITNEAFCDTVEQALKNYNNFPKLSSLFDDFFGHSTNAKFIKKAPLFSENVRASLVSSLVQLAKRPENIESYMTDAKIYSDYARSHYTLTKPQAGCLTHYYVALALDLIKK